MPRNGLPAPWWEDPAGATLEKTKEVFRCMHDAGVAAEGEILEGSPRHRISEFARDRGARLIVVGSRCRKLGQSVSTGVVRSAGRPVIVARSAPRLTAVA